MTLGSKLGVESRGMLASLVFYLVVGTIFLALLPLTGFPPHIGIIGISSLIVAYGMLKKRSWAIWFVVVFFLVATTFSAYMLYYYLLSDNIFSLAMMAYLLLTWFFTGYVALKRRSIES
jgi:hypothetical protein